MLASIRHALDPVRIAWFNARRELDLWLNLVFITLIVMGWADLSLLSLLLVLGLANSMALGYTLRFSALYEHHLLLEGDRVDCSVGDEEPSPGRYCGSQIVVVPGDIAGLIKSRDVRLARVQLDEDPEEAAFPHSLVQLLSPASPVDRERAEV